jgi:hypothetical protein
MDQCMGNGGGDFVDHLPFREAGVYLSAAVSLRKLTIFALADAIMFALLHRLWKPSEAMTGRRQWVFKSTTARRTMRAAYRPFITSPYHAAYIHPVERANPSKGGDAKPRA